MPAPAKAYQRGCAAASRTSLMRNRLCCEPDHSQPVSWHTARNPVQAHNHLHYQAMLQELRQWNPKTIIAIHGNSARFTLRLPVCLRSPTWRLVLQHRRFRPRHRSRLLQPIIKRQRRSSTVRRISLKPLLLRNPPLHIRQFRDRVRSRRDSPPDLTEFSAGHYCRYSSAPPGDHRSQTTSASVPTENVQQPPPTDRWRSAT